MSKLEALKSSLQKAYGEDSVMYASEIPPYRVFSTGSLSLDYAIGIGGLPTNRVVELAGAPGTGKSTLALHMINNRLNFEKANGSDRGAVYIDQENRMTDTWLNMFVDDPDKVIIVKPDTMEQATDIYVEAVQSKQIAIVVMDSIAAAPSQRVTNKSAEIGNVGGNALAVSRWANFATSMSGKYDVTTIGVNQVRDDMDGYRRLITVGGNAWKHACSLRIELKRGKDKIVDKINEEEMQVGYTVVARVHKNSLAAPFRQAWYWFLNVPTEKYGFGVDKVDEIVRLSLLTGVVEKVNQSNYYYEKLGKIRGRDNMISAIREDPEVQAEIVEKVMEKLSEGKVKGVASSFDEMATDDSDLELSVDQLLGHE